MRGIQAVWMAATACLTVFAGPSLAQPLGLCPLWHDLDLTNRLMLTHDVTINRDSEGRPIIPAFTKAVTLMQAHRWRDGLPLLLQTARTMPAPGSGETQRNAISALGEYAGLLAESIHDCPTWLPPDQSHSPAPVSVPWDALPKLPSAKATIIRP